MSKQPTYYAALTGLNYPRNRRAEPGDVVADLPAESIGWLLDQQLIRPATAAEIAAAAAAAPEATDAV